MPLGAQGEIQLPVTQAEIEACIARHEGVLVNFIRDGHMPPSGGEILTLVETLRVLHRDIVPMETETQVEFFTEPQS